MTAYSGGGALVYVIVNPEDKTVPLIKVSLPSTTTAKTYLSSVNKTMEEEMMVIDENSNIEFTLPGKSVITVVGE